MLRQPANGLRSTRVFAVRLLTGAASLGWLASALPASAQEPAPSKTSCAEAYESAQETRASGQLQQTRSRLAFCAQTECPAFVQKDCARWLEEVDRELPSVIVSVVGLDAAQASSASVSIDGRPVADALAGKAISLDPGKHELVLERPGAEPVKRTILAQQGVQNRSVEIQLEDASAPSQPGSPEADVGTRSASPLRTAAYASWGVGLVGFGAFAVLGTLARADKKGFEQDCAGVTSMDTNVRPGVCLDSTIDDKKAKYEREEVLADIGLVTGLVGAAAGTVLYVLSTSDGRQDTSTDPNASAAARLHLDVSPTPGGAWASVSGSF